MLYTVHEIRTKGNPPPFDDILTVTPWVDLVYYPGQPFSERAEFYRNVGKGFIFNVVKTHFYPPVFKLRDDLKYIVGFRNPYDAASSLEPFLTSHEESFARMWGGFPMGAGQPFDNSTEAREAYRKFLLVDMGNGETALGFFQLSFFEGWWPYRNHKNVLFVHYTDRIKHHAREVKRVLDFLNVPVNAEELEKITRHTTFANMKGRPEFDVRKLFDLFKGPGKIPESVKGLLQEGAMVKKGKDRDGSSELPHSATPQIAKILQDRFGKEITQYLVNGGPVPGVDLPKADSNSKARF